MARMIPSEPDADSPDPQRYVFGRLRERLPEDWTVLHARRFRLPADAASASDPDTGAEATAHALDFLVIDPARGVLALEVLGGRVERTRTGWIRKNPDGTTEELADPVARVRSAVHALDRHLGEPEVPLGFALLLPDVTAGDAALAAALPRELTIGRDDLADLPAAIGRALEAGTGAPRPLQPGAVAALVRSLAPHLRLVRTLASRIPGERAVLVRLTAEQTRTLDRLELSRRIAIRGGAGTGKTLLAAEWARRLATRGERTLLLCFNRQLGEFLAKSADGYAVSSFHRLCLELSNAAGIDFEVPPDGPLQRRFWEEEAAELLRKALASRPEALFDAVVVDEGQDFRAGWWPAVEGLLRVPDEGRLVVFFDPLQDLFGGGPPDDLLQSTLELTFNCRNTERIARFSHAVIGAEAGIRPGTPEGVSVELVHVRSDEETVQEVRRLLERLIDSEELRAEQIVILSTRSRDRSSLADLPRIGRFRLAPQSVDAPADRVRVASLHQFKGLEADVIVLVDVHAGDPNSAPGHVYVGASRARHLLVIVELRD